MKIYFAAAMTYYRDMLPMYQSICRKIEELGHEILSKHVLAEKTTEGSWERDYDPQKLFQREAGRIKEADVIVAELTTPSWGTAFLIEEAIRQKKTILSLYYGDYEGKVPLMLRGHPHLGLKIYTEENLGKLIENFFKNLK